MPLSRHAASPHNKILDPPPTSAWKKKSAYTQGAMMEYEMPSANLLPKRQRQKRLRSWNKKTTGEHLVFSTVPLPFLPPQLIFGGRSVLYQGGSSSSSACSGGTYPPLMKWPHRKVTHTSSSGPLSGPNIAACDAEASRASGTRAACRICRERLACT